MGNSEEQERIQFENEIKKAKLMADGPVPGSLKTTG